MNRGARKDAVHLVTANATGWKNTKKFFTRTRAELVFPAGKPIQRVCG